MPAGYTHYCFGKDVYKHLDDQNIKDLLLRNENCFLLVFMVQIFSFMKDGIK